uniref:Uncharacterized protein n=1 Tax=Solanum tuberosum TaxID=4113 RepID=M1DL29_SOLTU
MSFNINRSAPSANRPPDPPDFNNFPPLATNSQIFNNINKTQFTQIQSPTSGQNQNKLQITIPEAENTRWDKAQAIKTKEKQSEKTIRHRHNLRIRHTIKDNQTSQENVVKHVQENDECSKPNAGNPIKNLLGKKQRFESKITIPTKVFLEGKWQHNKVDKTVAWIPINLPSGATHTKDDDIREQVLEPDPPDAIKEQPQDQIMTLGDKPKQPQEMTKKYHEDDMETSISDDELTRESTSGKQTDMNHSKINQV